MIIYKLTSPRNRSYIGQTKRTLEIRFKEHCKSAHRGEESELNDELRLYSNPDDWNISTIEELPLESSVKLLNEAEIKWVAHFDTHINGLNMTRGGEGRHFQVLSEKHKRNISTARKVYFDTKEGQEWKTELSNKLKVNNPAPKKRKPLSDAHKESIRIANKGNSLTEDQKENQSEGMKKAWKEGKFDNRTIVTIPLEKRARGYKQSNYQKEQARKALVKSYQIEYEDGNTISVLGLKQFAIDNSIPEVSLRHAIKKETPLLKYGIKRVVRL